LGHRVVFWTICWLIFPKQWQTPLSMDIIHVLLIFSWFGQPPRKLHETMGGDTPQPRLEYQQTNFNMAFEICFQSKIL
jgi:hypothetical protein